MCRLVENSFCLGLSVDEDGMKHECGWVVWGGVEGLEEKSSLQKA